jgi:hypothetical protein
MARPLEDAIAQLRVAELALCEIVAKHAAARGWAVDAECPATPVERGWHELIGQVADVRAKVEEELRRVG